MDESLATDFAKADDGPEEASSLGDTTHDVEDEFDLEEDEDDKEFYKEYAELDNEERDELEIAESFVEYPSKAEYIVEIHHPQEQEEEEEEEIGKDGQIPSYFPSDYELGGLRAALSAEERREIIVRMRQLRSDARILTVVNKFLHKNYVNAMKNSATFASALDRFDEATVFHDERYEAALDEFSHIRSELSSRRANLSSELDTLKRNYESASIQCDDLLENLIQRESHVARNRVKLKARSSKESWLEQIDAQLESQRRRVADVSKIRLEQIMLQQKLDKVQAEMKRLDCLGPSFPMMEYENMLKRKGVYSEKRDEQIESLRKLGERNLQIAGIIKHVNEECDLFEEKVLDESKDLDAMSEATAAEYAKLVKLAEARASTFKKIMKMREEIGLLDNPFLLNKMEFDWKVVQKLNARIQKLQTRISTDEHRYSNSSPKQSRRVSKS
ncbi:hypothetical protein QAD02_004750 [Eretmocerus hayati]|uniref:Uncharacterized protein n=1 Tax=Eretmocerus hayati TaxID=131215 RepID=A0ACC2NRM1_9HYME|nr:hypothetical protein QAD02_004750 [Eretmocerus hayati]